MNENDFKWVDYSTKIAEIILTYKNNDMELMKIINNILIKIAKKEINTIEVDGYTAMNLIFEQLPKKRNDIINSFLKETKNDNDIKEPIKLEEYSGIPNIQWVIRITNGSKEEEELKNKLWNLFEITLKYGNNMENSNLEKDFIESFDLVLHNLKRTKAGEIHEGFIKALTVSMFLCNPNSFIPLDKNTLEEISNITNEKYDKASSFISGKEYVGIIKKVKEYIKENNQNYKTIYELSDYAYYAHNKKNKKNKNNKNNKNNKEDKRTIHYPKNLILYGPPGTGKTYNSKKITYSIINNEKREIKDIINDNSLNYDDVCKYLEEHEEQIKFITFHQSYGYEDFIQGIRAETCNGNIEYHVRDGIFKAFCDIARDNNDKNYVFVIDEINRGNISKIFGELITLVEEDKREKMEITLPYRNDNGEEVNFTIPNNVYIIGTMNTADRSIAMMDTALRRRFDFIEVMPDGNLLKNIEEIEGVKIKDLFETINKRIEFLYDREHTIGHSYFMKIQDKESLKNTFANKIIPLLQEYFYDDYKKIQLILGNDIIEEVKEEEIEQYIHNVDIGEKFKISADALNKIDTYKKIIETESDENE